MMRRLGAFWSASGLLATALVALSAIQGSSAANADSFQDWTSVAAGANHTCGIRHGGKLYCWGYDFYGQVGDGDGDSTPVASPRRIGTFEDWSTASAGFSHTCGVRHGGKLYCWGSDDFGKLGDGGPSDDAAAPHRIGAFEDWSNVAAGRDHTCGVRKNGKLYCWGSDGSGQLGDGEGDSTPVSTPRRIGTFEDWANVKSGGDHTCGVRRNGKLYCWGNDKHGQLGDDEGTAEAPRRIGSFEDWASVSAGEVHSCGVRKNGKLYCWGYDSEGQVGDGGSNEDAPSPHRIGTFEDWVSASAGEHHSCGVRANGKLYCWGSDTAGQIGDGSNPEPATSPRRIGSFEDWIKASAGDLHSCGVRANGKLYCWGYDLYGQLGDGEPLSSQPSPTRI